MLLAAVGSFVYFQMAARLGVEHDHVIRLGGDQTIDIDQILTLGLLGVLQHSAGSAHTGRVDCKVEGGQVRGAEVPGEALKSQLNVELQGVSLAKLWQGDQLIGQRACGQNLVRGVSRDFSEQRALLGDVGGTQLSGGQIQ